MHAAQPGRPDAAARRRARPHQRGNNNAYCQDNELSWVDWSGVDEDLLDFTRRLIRLRAEHPVLRRRVFFTGASDETGVPDIAWLRTDGEPMGAEDWDRAEVRALAVLFNGHAMAEPGPRGEEIDDDTFWLLMNPGADPVQFAVPQLGTPASWVALLYTGADPVWTDDSSPAVTPNAVVPLLPHALALFVADLETLRWPEQP